MKNIYDYSHVKSVSAYVLIDINTSEIHGKIIANWSDNPNGSVCTAQIMLYKEYPSLKPKIKYYESEFLKGQPFNSPLIGKASGYGYDKLSSAISNAIHNNCTEYPSPDFAGVGEGAMQKYFLDNFNLDAIKIV